MQSVIAACDSDPVDSLLDPVRSPAHIALVAFHGAARGRKVSPCDGEAKFIEAFLSDVFRTPPALAALDSTKEAVARIHLAKGAA
jgi:hypothetical protein